MQKVWSVVRDAVKNVDPVLFVCSVLLSIISIVTIAGAVDNFGASKLRMQIAMFVLGTIVTFAIAYVDYRAIIDKLWLPMLLASAALLILTLFLGSSGENMETANQSWLRIPGTGLMIQPSEFVKFTFVCTFSKHLFTVQERINHPVNVILLALHAGLIVGLILLSGDLGVALVYIAMIAIMLFCAGLNPLYFVGVIAVVILLAPYLWDSLAEYQQMRIIVGFNPELDPDYYGWQALMSRDAIAAGGFFGLGVGGGRIYEILTASHTDFIFATICEKFGFFGGFIVLLLFMIMVIRIIMIARNASRSDYGGLICVGVGALLIIQVLENVGMCLAMLPVVGITLPFLSCGGSSMLATFLMFGLLHNVHAHSKGVRDASRVDTLDINASLMR